MIYDRSRGHSVPLPEMMFPPIVMTLIPIVMTFLSAVIMFAPTVITASPAVTMFPAMMMTFLHGAVVAMTIPLPKHLPFFQILTVNLVFCCLTAEFFLVAPTSFLYMLFDFLPAGAQEKP